MESEQSSEYVQNMMKQMVAATGVPSCFVCGDRIVGAHLDYMDMGRTPRKVCVGCAYKALDYYIEQRNKSLKIGNP